MNKAILFFLMGTLTIFSCSKDAEENEGGNQNEEVLTYVKFKVGGELIERDTLEFNADNLLTGTLSLQFRIGEKELNINTNEFMDVAGNYDLTWLQYRDGSTTYYGDTGTLIITEINKDKEYVSGTFAGSGTSIGGIEQSISDGEFTMKYYPL